MFQEIPIKLEMNTDHPMYKAAIRDVVRIIDNENDDTAREKEGEYSGTYIYKHIKMNAHRRIRDLITEMAEMGEDAEQCR